MWGYNKDAVERKNTQDIWKTLHQDNRQCMVQCLCAGRTNEGVSEEWQWGHNDEGVQSRRQQQEPGQHREQQRSEQPKRHPEEVTMLEWMSMIDEKNFWLQRLQQPDLVVEVARWLVAETTPCYCQWQQRLWGILNMHDRSVFVNFNSVQ